MDRREFLKTVLRISALGGLSILGIKAVRSAGRLSGQSCASDGICARCAVVSGCGLPQALSYRQVKGS
jgi:hypothetical protein